MYLNFLKGRDFEIEGRIRILVLNPMELNGKPHFWLFRLLLNFYGFLL